MQPGFSPAPQMQAPMMPQQGRTSGFASDLTDKHLPNVMNSVTAQGGIYVNFFYVKVRIKARDASTNGQFQDRLCISKQPKGDRLTIACRFITEERAAREWPREFQMFKQYEEVPTTGTPLKELPGISMSQIGLLTLNGLRSIEDLCGISEDLVGQMGLDAIRAHKTAKAWFSKREENAENIALADLEARMKIQLDTLEKNNEAMAERNRQLEAQVQALQTARGAPPAETADQAVAVEAKEDLEYDIDKMPDPFSEGPGSSDGDDDLNATDIDPLADSE